jgi:hypothetical protein
MRLYAGAALLVVVVVGGFWLVLALTFSHPSSNSDAFTRSASCVRRDPSLTTDRTDAARLATSGVRTLGLRSNGVRAVALFADSPAPVRRAEARIVASLRNERVTTTEIDARLLREDDVGLFYLDAAPSQAAQQAIGQCVYLVRYNRIASFFGLSISPHARRPFLPGARRDDPPAA